MSVRKTRTSDLASERFWNAKKRDEKLERERLVALTILDVDPRELQKLPQFSPILEASFGGLEQVLAAMRLSMDPAIAKFIERYDKLNPHHQKVVPWEAIAMLAEIDGRQLLGAIIFALREYSAAEVKVAALSAHAEVTRATVEAALGPDGVRDRQMIHTALGFLAPPKGQTINVNFPGPVEDGDSEREIAPEDIDMDAVFPDLMETQKKMKMLSD